jgi:hypothetical protein
VKHFVLLEAVRSMHQLQHLTVTADVSPLDLAHEQGHHLAALTALTRLTHFEIVSMQYPPLPATAIQHMFPPGVQFPQLQELLLYVGSYHAICCMHEHDSGVVGHVTTAELRSIISACPALRRLQLMRVLAADVDVSVLLQLPVACRSLAVGGRVFDDHAAAVIAQLTQLTYLEWKHSPGLTDAGRQLLTALTSLKTTLVGAGRCPPDCRECN